jgi:hypothetical protein
MACYYNSGRESGDNNKLLKLHVVELIEKKRIRNPEWQPQTSADRWAISIDAANVLQPVSLAFKHGNDARLGEESQMRPV